MQAPPLSTANRPNIIFLLADQLRAASLPRFGEFRIETPYIDRLAEGGVSFTNAISTCPVCTPYRSMLVTGRYPQTTGHLLNFVRTRHDELSIADAFSAAGYRTGWIGKWHLHTGSFPHSDTAMDWVPSGRDRLGFEHWRAYNFHSKYFDGFVHGDGWRVERWEGYETDALSRYAFEFMEKEDDRPFCLFVSPHQPHSTTGRYAPESYYERLPAVFEAPPGSPEERRAEAVEMYRHYLAMVLAIDDMVGAVDGFLERSGLRASTLFVVTSDHGTEAGAHGVPVVWNKMRPYENSIRVPLVMRLPGVFDGGRTCDAVTTPIDFFPSLCALCGIPVPRTVEGMNLLPAWTGEPDARRREDALIMNFVGPRPNWCTDGIEWRGVRTRDYMFVRWREGGTELFDLRNDPLQQHNLSGTGAHADLEHELSCQLDSLLAARHDKFLRGSDYASWFDEQRRVVQNAFGPCAHPESSPDYSLLFPADT